MVAEGLTQMLPRNKTWGLSSWASDSYYYCMIYGLPISLKVKSEKNGLLLEFDECRYTLS